MEDKLEEAMVNYFRWFTGLLIVALAIFGNSYLSLQPLLYRTLGVIFLVTLSLGVLVTTIEGKAALKIILDSRSEIRRVVWPTRNETTQTTMIVIVAVSISGLVLWGLDSLFGLFTSSILG